MDTIEREKIIDRIVGKRYDTEIRNKLCKLLNERHIDYLLPKNTMEFRKSISSGTYGIVDLVRYQKKLYAHKKPRGNSDEQRNSILGEAIKLTEIFEYHPNIQRLYFINLDSFGFLMDYCDCGSLDKFVTDSNSTYSLIDVLNWSYQLADALSFLHSKNIMHRDVKMQNILLKDNCQTLVLTDYGTATNLGRNLLTNNVGTPVIMAPEVCRGTNYTEQCDIYSWAIVFWQLIAKQFSPYDNLITTYALMMKVVTDKLRPAQLDPCPKIFLALMYRSWHSNPQERPSLFFIKKVLRLLLNNLPKEKSECSNDIKNQCTNESNSLEKYLPSEPRLHNERSKNIYEEHSKKFKIICDIKHEILNLEENINAHKQQKSDEQKQLTEENEKLQDQINQLQQQINALRQQNHH